MRDDLTSDGILLVVQGEDDLRDVQEFLNRGVGWEELVPKEEHEFQEGPELDCPVVAHAIDVFTWPEADIEAQLYQVGDAVGFWVGGRDSLSHDGLDDANGGGILTLDGGILNTIGFELTGKEHVQAGVSLGVEGLYGVGEAIQEVGHCNRAPCLRN